MFELATLLAALEVPVTAPSGASSTTAIVVAALSAGGIGAIFAAIVSGLFSKRKLGAEATEIITKAAAGVVSNLQAEVDRINAARKVDQSEHEQVISDMARAYHLERAEWKRVLQLHVAWDQLAITKLADLGIELPDAPPMLPARKFVDDEGMPLDVDSWDDHQFNEPGRPRGLAHHPQRARDLPDADPALVQRAQTPQASAARC